MPRFVLPAWFRSPAVVPLAIFGLLATCAGPETTAPRAVPSGILALVFPAESGTTCSVTITGPTKICHDCEKGKQPSTKLTAVGIPAGGKYVWDLSAGSDKASLKSKHDKAFVSGVSESTAKEDVTLHVTYTVQGMSCQDNHPMTVVVPKSLRVLDDWMFVVANGQLVSISRNGTAQTPPLPANVAEDANQVLRHVKAGQEGALLVRYYEVLDQFKERWECDGDLKEELTPKLGRKGGTKVKQGIPEHPDRIYLFQSPPFTETTQTQVITVEGCVVRKNKITFKSDRVEVVEA